MFKAIVNRDEIYIIKNYHNCHQNDDAKQNQMKKINAMPQQWEQTVKEANEFGELIRKLDYASEEGLHITKKEAKEILYQLLKP
jgi:hypothetical protein